MQILDGELIDDSNKILSVDIFEDGKAWGINWTDQKNAGVFPNYFIDKGNTIEIIQEPYSDEFNNTDLLRVVFCHQIPMELILILGLIPMKWLA